MKLNLGDIFKDISPETADTNGLTDLDHCSSHLNEIDPFVWFCDAGANKEKHLGTPNIQPSPPPTSAYPITPTSVSQPIHTLNSALNKTVSLPLPAPPLSNQIPP